MPVEGSLSIILSQLIVSYFSCNGEGEVEAVRWKEKVKSARGDLVKGCPVEVTADRNMTRDAYFVLMRFRTNRMA